MSASVNKIGNSQVTRAMNPCYVVSSELNPLIDLRLFRTRRNPVAQNSYLAAAEMKGIKEEAAEQAFETEMSEETPFHFSQPQRDCECEGGRSVVGGKPSSCNTIARS